MTSAAPGPADPLRRELLRLGALGAVALSAVSAGAALGGCSRRTEAAAAGHAWLRDGDVVLLRALLPAILDGALPVDAAARAERLGATLARIDAAAAGYGQRTQAALRQLLDLMSFAPTRRLLCGVGPWREADPATAGAFLDRWRSSSSGLLNAGYRALTRMSAIAYFSIPATWPASGYPGPLAWVYHAANGRAP